jgi:hypothetical protein
MTNPSCSVETRWGGSEEAPSRERLGAIIAQLGAADEEHPDTWLSQHASGWTLRLDQDRHAFLEDADGEIVGRLSDVNAARAAYPLETDCGGA